ncbi:hypothetical protein ACFVUH_16355 [Kitasatospora sp. NPDC058032]|uniref:hypothetical protein n=1 Tax=Kitasatospora sp. NPDC058032 TaxID=3346307 RepID=UPI0036DA98EA
MPSSAPSTLSKLTRIALAASIAASGAVAVTAFTTTTAHAATTSTVGGQISRSEVISRAQYWFNQAQNPALSYSWYASFPDSSGRYYRKDCSGYVSMAWHLGYSADTRAIEDSETYEIPRSELRAGDVLNSYRDHVLLFEKWDDAAHTRFSYYAFGSTPVKHATNKSINDAQFDSHPNSDYKALRYKHIVEDVTTAPSALPAGTLVKSPNGSTVKVIINGAGVPVTGADVAADGYDLSKVVTVDDGAFNALPTVPPPGTVVHDQGGGNSRYVVIGNAALTISGSDWTADGYDKRPDLGVPTSWLQGAVASTPSTGLVVMDQSGADNSRYVIINGSAVPIGAPEWTADGYDKQTLMGVPTDWLRNAAARQLAPGTVVMNQSGTDNSRYVMVDGAALPISAAEWQNTDYSLRPLMGVPGTWLNTAATKSPSSGTVVMDQTGTDNSRYVMINGTAVPINATEWTADGYNTRPLLGVPGAWLNTAAHKPVPDGTLIKGQAGADSSVYVMVNGSALPLTGTEYATTYGNRSVLGVPEAWQAAQAARPLANGTVIKNADNTDSSIYVMAGGKAVPLTPADFTGYGYDQAPLRAVPGTWEQQAAAKSAPSNGTLLQSSDSTTVWQVVAGGSKKAAAPGSYNPADVVKVPTALTAGLPTVTA